VPVYILAVPLVSGGQWATDQQLADVVQNAVGRPGVYLTLNANFNTEVDAWTWPSDPTGFDQPPYHAADAAQAANLEQSTATDAPVWQTFLRTVQLITSGQGVSALNAQEHENTGGQAANSSSDGGSGAGAAIGGVLAALVVTVTLTVTGLRRRRRRRSVRHAAGQAGVPPFTSPPAVTAAARAATEAGLRDRAQAELLELGELLEQPIPAGTPAPHSDEGDADLTRALDAYDAAGHALDSADGIPDLAGVLVLTQMGRCAVAAAQSCQAGEPAPPALPLCFFNPLHGTAPREVRWPALGGRETVKETLTVYACDACADAIAQRRPLDVLTTTRGKVEMRWYEDASSIWAATGYGQFSDSELIKRVLDRK
jgi:hypothetical protein